MIWLLLALGGAIFTSLTTIFTKIGIKDVSSRFATFYRTGVVILCCIMMCFVTSTFKEIKNISLYNYLFLGLSGVATGCSWLCYNKALKRGSVNQVASIDKSSFILTSLLFLIFFFDDTTKNGNILTIIMLFVSIFFLFIGSLLMVPRNNDDGKTVNGWFIPAILSAIFASFVSLFIKIGLKGIPSNIGTLFRTIVVFIISGFILFVKKDKNQQTKQKRKVSKRSWIFLTISGIATGAAWLLEYEALNYIGSNPVVVNSMGKLSIAFTMLFSYVILKEKFSKRSLLGLSFLILGIVVIIVFGL